MPRQRTLDVMTTPAPENLSTLQGPEALLSAQADRQPLNPLPLFDVNQHDDHY
jgi:hypothetical protein